MKKIIILLLAVVGLCGSYSSGELMPENVRRFFGKNLDSPSSSAAPQSWEFVDVSIMIEEGEEIVFFENASYRVYIVGSEIICEKTLMVESGCLFAFGDYGYMVFENGGRFVVDPTPDSTGEIPTVDFISYYGYNYTGYYCPLIIEESAGVCKIENLWIQGAYVGLISNGYDKSPIRGNYFYGDYHGVISYGPRHPKIVYNQMFGLGSVYFGMSPEFSVGITFFNDPNSVEKTKCFTMGNTVVYSDVGIECHGIKAKDVAEFTSINDVFCMIDFDAFNCVDYYLGISVNNPGFYEVGQEQNFEFDISNPVSETAFPYEFGNYQLYLLSSTKFVDVAPFILADEDLDLVTFADGRPDVFKADLGVHHRTSSELSSFGSRTDFNLDGITNLKDFGYFQSYWGYDPNVIDPNDFDPNYVRALDLTGNGTVDVPDLIHFSESWLDKSFFDFKVPVPLKVSGKVFVPVPILPGEYFVFVDGERIAGLEEYEGSWGFYLPTDMYSNGQHFIKIVGRTDFGVIRDKKRFFNTENLFSNREIENLKINGVYHGDKKLKLTVYSFMGFEKLGEFNLDSEIISTNLDPNWGSVDEPLTFKVEEIIEKSPGASSLINSPAPPPPPDNLDEIYGRWVGCLQNDFIFDPNSSRVDQVYVRDRVNFLITLPDPDLAKDRREAIWQMLNTVKMKGIPYKVLYHHNANFENIYLIWKHGKRVCDWYNLAHGNYRILRWNLIPVERSFFKYWCRKEIGPGRYDYVERSVFDYLGRDTPSPDDDELLGSHETNAFSLRSLDLWKTTKVRIVIFDTCYGGRNRINSSSVEYNPFALALGMYNSDGQVLLSWRDDGHTGGLLEGYNMFVRGVWYYLLENSVFHSIFEAIHSAPPGAPAAYIHAAENFNMSGGGQGDLAKLIDFKTQ